MTNIIGFSRASLQMNTDAQVRNAAPERTEVQAQKSDSLAISDEASMRLEGLPQVDAPEVTNFVDAMKMARNTVQMILERPNEARVAHVPDLGARVAGLVA